MYQLFLKKMTPYIVFSIKDIEKEFGLFDKKNLVNWQKKEYITKIRNGYYCFSDIEKNEFFLYHTSNKIYTPSYISLETALANYNIIPEGVFSIIGITTLKTTHFSSPIGQFEYKHVKPSLFFGYKIIKFQNQIYKIAAPEKAILDYIYLHPNLNHLEDFNALRWNKKLLSNLDLNLFKQYQLLFNSNALNNRIAHFFNYLYA